MRVVVRSGLLGSVFCLAAAAGADRQSRPRAGGLSGQAGADDRAVRARGTCRHHRASRRAEDDRGIRQAVLCREPRRRGRQYRRGGRGARARRRLQHHADQPGHRDQSASLQVGALRSGQGLRRGHAHRHLAERAGGASFGAGQDRHRAGRADQEGARQVHRLRAAGPGHLGASDRRTVPPDLEARSSVDPVRRRRADDPVGGRGPHADRVLVDAAGRGPDPGRHAARRSPSPAKSASTACRTFRP